MMGAQPSGAETPHRRREIAAHFKGRGSKETDALMRAHLQVCPSCVRHYERYMLLASVDPRLPSPQVRLGRSLGFRGERTGPAPVGSTERAPRFRPRTAWLALGATGLAAMMLLGRAGLHRSTAPAIDEADGFRVRGAEPPRGSTWPPSFWTYRIPPTGTPVLADRSFSARDELAFAYSNRAGLPYLMLFGVDEHRHVYWFHPAWPSGAPAPTAIRVAAGPDPHELGAAIRHNFDGRRLMIYAVASARALDAPFIEGAVRSALDPEAPGLFGSEGAEIRWSRRGYEVTP